MEEETEHSETGVVKMARAIDLVERVMQDVDSSSVTEIDVLLTDLLCAAWPTAVAQSQ
jgi:hypothetical protein